MLDVLDSIFRGFFAYGIPAILFTYGAVVSILVLWYVCSKLDPEVPAWYRAYSKLDAIGFACLNVCCIHWFFVWRAQSIALSGSDRPDISTVVAMLFMTVVLYIPIFARMIFIPLWLSGFIYVAIEIWGL